ncbi:hypothetical protein LEP1GSC021_1298 [Leptospira noguchii str. 1993005606]|nr:hypothetical protein LEP1GSC021_1298 [Leptospira noguchii str. 1993005606]
MRELLQNPNFTDLSLKFVGTITKSEFYSLTLNLRELLQNPNSAVKL